MIPWYMLCSVGSAVLTFNARGNHQLGGMIGDFNEIEFASSMAFGV